MEPTAGSAPEAKPEVEVEATTIPAPEDAKDEGPADMSQALAVMVRRQGRAATAWALIKTGFKVLFGGSVK